jgi:hypothetical protein
MSTPTQYPKTNIVKLNPPSSSTTRDNSAVDGVSFFFLLNRDFYQILHRKMSSIRIDNVFFFLDDVTSYDRSFFHICIRTHTFASFFLFMQ